MAFTATHVMKLNNDPNVAPVTYSLTGACLDVDFRGIFLSPEGNWTGVVHVYANQATFDNNVFDWIPGFDFTASAQFSPGQDAYDLLCAATKALYSNAADI